MTHLAILADDLTGAADAGGVFASAGLRTVIAFGDTDASDVDVLVRSTGSRGLDSADAVEANRRAAMGIRKLPPSLRPHLIYKKIDSMLRGHPCEELLAVMAGLGERRALVAPALPDQRRTTEDGRQLIDDVPIDEAGPATNADLISIFGCDGTLPPRTLDIATVRRGVDAIANVIGEMETGILVADAQTDDDLLAIAHAAIASGIRVMAGSAGLARQLAAVLPAPATTHPALMPTRQRAPVLVVAGSRHPATAAQVAAMADAGVPVVRPSELLDEADIPMSSTVAELATHLSAHQSAVLTTAGLAAFSKGAAFVVRQLAEVVAALAERRMIGGLVLTGGDVAAGALARLGATELVLGGEVQPAIPWGVLRSRLLPEVPVATKAGSFGERDALLRCLERIGP